MTVFTRPLAFQPRLSGELRVLSLSSQSIRWFSVAGINFSRDLEAHILMTIFLICSLLHILALVFKTITLFKKMAEILAIWVRGTCAILRSTVTSTPSWHVLLLDCPVTTSLHSLRNWSRWLHTADQTILFASKCPIVQFSNAWAPWDLFLYEHHFTYGEEMTWFVCYLIKRQRK